MRHPPSLFLTLCLTAAACGSPPTETGAPGDVLAPSTNRDRPPAGGAGIYGLSSPGPRRGCDQLAGARQFDFWVGQWAITNAAGNPAGASRITSELNGCAVFEFFGGGFGLSLNRYDGRADRWTQDYVDNTGFTLRLAGGLDAAGAMRMEDEIRAIPNGPALKSRFVWTPNQDGTVRQVWNFSRDGGASFLVNFNGLYAANPAYVDPAPPAPGACLNRPAQRAADGFVGTWEVRTDRGRKVGMAELTLEAASCLIVERFAGPGQFEHRAFLYFDRFVGQWFRMHADNQGGGYRLSGTVSGSTFVLTADEANDGRPTRLTWNLDSADRATQVWETQALDGTWRVSAKLVWVRVA